MPIKLTEIDLSKPLQPIYVESRYSQLSAVVSWGFLPLGMVHVQCHSPSRTISPEQLRSESLQALGWQLWEHAVAGSLDKLDDGTDQLWPPISVVVCTRDRPLSLERCLENLAQLEYPTYEVVIVDNCSRDHAVSRVATNSGFRCVREDTPGLDWARNQGVRESKYDIIAFIDDDALATRGWLRGIASGFEDPEVMAVTGMVLPAEVETPAQADFECYGGMSKGWVGRTIQREKLSDEELFWASAWGVGTNMAFRRTLFETIGDFDVALDVGTPTNGGGDIEFFHRTVAAGFALRYEPAAMVRHVHRRDTAAFRRQIYNNGRSFTSYLLTLAHNEPHRRNALLRFAIRRWIGGWLLRRLLSSLAKRDRWTFRLALTEFRGCFSAPRSHRKSRKLASQFRSMQSVQADAGKER
jgi:glycosyltransferase involved in cell wall biosynthesis